MINPDRKVWGGGRNIRITM